MSSCLAENPLDRSKPMTTILAGSGRVGTAALLHNRTRAGLQAHGAKDGAYLDSSVTSLSTESCQTASVTSLPSTRLSPVPTNAPNATVGPPSILFSRSSWPLSSAPSSTTLDKRRSGPQAESPCNQSSFLHSIIPVTGGCNELRKTCASSGFVRNGKTSNCSLSRGSHY